VTNGGVCPNINGGILWLMSSPRYGTYRQPPTIIGRLEISDVVPSDHPKADHVDDEVRKFQRSPSIYSPSCQTRSSA
jgi:hypothetical protein